MGQQPQDLMDQQTRHKVCLRSESNKTALTTPGQALSYYYSNRTKFT